jgi:hypothetical protein
MLGRTFPTRLAVALVAAGWLAAPAAAADDPFQLLRYIPPQGNAVVVLNVDYLLSSPRAAKEGWGKQDRAEYLAGVVPLHPAIDRIVLARHFDPAAPGTGPMVAALTAKTPIDVSKLAVRFGGQETTVAEEPAVLTPNGSVLVPLGPNTLGVARMDSRQDVARWVRFTRGAEASPLSKYMNQAVAQFAQRHHICLAVDAEDLFEKEQVRAAIAASDAFGGAKPTEVAAVETFAVGLRGVLFLADVKQGGLSAQIRIASGPTAGLKKPGLVKQFVAEFLDRHGAAFENLGGATETIETGVVSLKFDISDQELARVLGLFVPPMPPAALLYTVHATPTEVSAEATQKYVRAIGTILDDLKAQGKKATEYEKTAVWHDSAANAIESRSVIGVDKRAVEYGAGTAARLRAIADSLRGVPGQVAALEGQAYAIGYVPRATMLTRGGVRRNPWLGYGTSVNTNVGEIRVKQMEAVKADAANRAKLWAEIDKKRSEVELLSDDRK